MKVADLIEKYSADLASSGIENSRNEARWLVLETLGLSGAALFSGAVVAPAERSHLDSLVARRCSHEPLQYILGNAPFGELDLKVTPAVLIPRCETELLVDYAVRHLPERGKLLDVGCGSGAIGLLSAYRRRDIDVTAVDKSPEALKIARENAQILGVHGRMKFYESDLLSALGDEKYDIIAANLPYVTFEEYSLLAPEVRGFEPQMALTAPDEGMELIFKLIAAAPGFIFPGGRIVLEMSPHQTARATAMLKKCGFADMDVFPDQFGKMRFVAASLR